MTPEEKAEELVEKFRLKVLDYDGNGLNGFKAKQCALLAVDYIITSNPHSNPFNTDVHSTMAYWMNVKKEIQKL